MTLKEFFKRHRCINPSGLGAELWPTVKNPGLKMTKKITDIIKFKIDHKKLEENFENLIKKTAKGVFNYDLLAGINDFQPEENKKNIYNFLKWSINNI